MKAPVKQTGGITFYWGRIQAFLPSTQAGNTQLPPQAMAHNVGFLQESLTSAVSTDAG